MARVGVRRALLYKPPVVSANWWEVTGKTCVVAYQPKGAADLAASYVNLANPGVNNAAPGTAPTFDAVTGWEFVAASATYLSTGVVPANGYSMIVRFSNGPTTGLYWLCGVDSASNARFYLSPRFNDNCIYGSGGLSSVAPHITTGVLAVAGQYGYRNGVLNTGAIVAWSIAQANPIFIGAVCDIAGTPAYHISAKVQALAIYSDTLSGPEVAALTTIMAAL